MRIIYYSSINLPIEEIKPLILFIILIREIEKVLLLIKEETRTAAPGIGRSIIITKFILLKLPLFIVKVL